MKTLARGILAFALLTPFVHAQFDEGQIAGTVTDTSQAIVVSAQVKAINANTGLSHSAETGPGGTYVLTNLPIGLYTVTVEAPGFKKFEHSGVRVDAAVRTTIDVTLEVGLVTESVTVAATAAQLQEETAQISRTVETQQITDLALNGRNPINLALLKAGVIGGNFNTFNPDSTTNGGFSINGGQSGTIDITMDGVNVLRDRNGEAAVGVFNPDAIAEVQVLTSTMPAEYGRSKDGQIRYVSKSGGRDFHGTVYEFFRNTVFDSNTWTRNTSPIADQNSSPAALHFNQFGGTLGGPIVIPNKFNTGRNKLFFFVGEEGIFFRQAQENTGTVPSLLMRQGDFSELLNPSNAFFGKVRLVTDPLSGAAFPNNVIPVNRQSHNGMAIMSVWPLPVAGFQQGAANWIQSRIQSDNDRKDFFRVDWYVSNKNRLYLSGNNFMYHADDAFYTGMAIAPTHWDWPNRSGILNLTTTISPTVVNEASFSAAADEVRLSLDAVNGQDLWDRSLYGVNFPYIYPLAGKKVPDRVPEQVSITGFTTMYANNRPSNSSGPMYHWTDNLTWIVGAKHTLKFGVDFGHEDNNNNDQTNYLSGQFTFLDTGNPLTSGVALANMALGNFDTYIEAAYTQYTLGRSNVLEAYAQDSWKATSKVTLEYGLRFEYYQPWYAVWNDLANFDQAYYDPNNLPTMNPQTGVITSGNPFNGIVLPDNGYPASAKGRAYGVNVPGSQALFHGLPRSLCNCQTNAFAPRLGIAYRVADKTVIRAGAGVFNNREFMDTNTLIKNEPNTLKSTVTYGSVDNPGATLLPGQSYLFTLTALGWKSKVPTAYSYSLSVQRQLPASTLLDVAYVGKTADHLPVVLNPNQLSLGATFAHPGVNAGYLRPWFGLGDFQEREFMAGSNYNSFQVSVQRRFKSGFEYDLAYTLSRSIDDTTSPYDAYNLHESSKGVSSFNRTQVLNFNFMYQLPFFHNTTGLENRLLAGWQLSSVTFFRSGDPLSVTDSTDMAGVGLPNTGTQRWNLTGNTAAPGPTGINKLWFNPAAFTLPANGTWGNSGLDILTGPSFWNSDAALFKNIKFTERLSSQFRFEAYDFLNHPNLGDPSVSPRSGSFGVSTSKSDNRTLQVGLKFLF